KTRARTQRFPATVRPQVEWQPNAPARASVYSPLGRESYRAPRPPARSKAPVRRNLLRGVRRAPTYRTTAILPSYIPCASVVRPIAVTDRSGRANAPFGPNRNLSSGPIFRVRGVGVGYFLSR